MTKILVIEDEKIERETLVKILQDTIPSIEVFQAKNGKEALELYDKKHPSIVLADINIPLISGLEVIKRIKEYQSDCEFLILSSYDYFNYAQEAIRLGVEDFILKPYKIPELIHAVHHIIEKQKMKSMEQKTKSELIDKIEKYTPIMENECFYTIMSNGDELTLKQKLQLLDKHIVCGFCVINTKKEAQELLLKDMKLLGYRVLSGQLHGEFISFVFLNHWIFCDEKKAFLLHFSKLKEKDADVKFGSLEEDIHVYESYQQAKKNQYDEFASKEDLLKREEEGREQLIKKMIQAFDDMDEERVKKTTASYVSLMLSKEQLQLEEDVQLLLDQLLIYLKDTYISIQLDAISCQSIAATGFQEVMLFVQVNIMNYYHAMVSFRFKNTNQLVRQALKYIDTNYRKPITLNDMAEALHVSPFYISKLLNTSMKKTFTELVSERRVEASKELLKTNKRIKEIAYEVGFQGQNYFTKIFKKYTGVTPKVYKNTFDEEKL